jgi:hypothetical protein
LTSVHPFGGDEQLLLVLEPKRVPERDAGQRSAATRVVDDLSDDALEVPVSLAEVEAAEPGRALAVVGVGLEYGSGSLTLSSDYSTHFWVRIWERRSGGEGERREGGVREREVCIFTF